MITYKIDVTKIDKKYIFEGKKGKYIDGAFIENRDGPDQYGNDGFITQNVPKEERDKGVKGPIIGNWKRRMGSKSNTPKPQDKPEEYDPNQDVPF